MKNYLIKLRLLPRSFAMLIVTAVLLLAVFTFQVNCPICNTIVADSSGNSLDNLKVLEVSSEILDYKTEHQWCQNSYLSLTSKVYISRVNEGSEPLAIPMVIKGIIPPTRLERNMVVENANLIQLEILGNETKHIEIVVKIKRIGAKFRGILGISDLEFLVITDPDEIVANCPVCGSKQKVDLIKRLKVNSQ